MEIKTKSHSLLITNIIIFQKDNFSNSNLNEIKDGILDSVNLNINNIKPKIQKKDNKKNPKINTKNCISIKQKLKNKSSKKINNFKQEYFNEKIGKKAESFTNKKFLEIDFINKNNFFSDEKSYRLTNKKMYLLLEKNFF